MRLAPSVLEALGGRVFIFTDDVLCGSLRSSLKAFSSMYLPSLTVCYLSSLARRYERTREGFLCCAARSASESDARRLIPSMPDSVNSSFNGY